jgi:hypothetical protein
MRLRLSGGEARSQRRAHGVLTIVGNDPTHLGCIQKAPRHRVAADPATGRST